MEFKTKHKKIYNSKACLSRLPAIYCNWLCLFFDPVCCLTLFKVGSLSWDRVETADYYIVTAESNSGHKIPVRTNETQTYISEFMCGEEYFLSVQSVDAHCTSGPSEPSKLQSGNCHL